MFTKRKFSAITFLLFLLNSGGLLAQELDKSKQYQVTCIGFYNIENLYDTIDTPGANDEEFTPAGANKWNSPKYAVKLEHMAKVLSELASDVTPDGPAIMGLCEIENKQVLEDLVKQPSIKSRNYQIVHFDGPDRRGVDCALLYNPKYFKVTNAKSYQLRNPKDTSWRTRDQLMVSGILDGSLVHIIVNHWPSRRGGEKKSEPLRALAGDLGRKIMDSILTTDANSKIIYLGDLNDDPTDKSVRKHLKASGKREDVNNQMFYNTMYDLFQKGIGTLAHNDSWNLFDQVIVSPGLINDKFNTYTYYQSRIFNKQYLRQADGRFKDYPFRTYSGGSWTGGYSDHFPVFIVLLKEKKQ